MRLSQRMPCLAVPDIKLESTLHRQHTNSASPAEIHYHLKTIRTVKELTPPYGTPARKTAKMDMFRHREAPVLQYPCFHSTVIVTANSKHYKLTNILFDSGASSNFVSRAFCKKLGLKYYPFLAERSFSTANGNISHTEEVDLMVSVAGVWQKLSFIVREKDDMTMLLGTPAFWKYQLQMRWGFGAKRETLVTVEPDAVLQPNLEAKSIVVEADRYRPMMVIELKDVKVQNEALKLGETIEQRQERQGAEAAAVSLALQDVNVGRAIEDALSVFRP